MGAKSDQWMPLYIAKYEAATNRLSLAEDGAYMRLIRDYWLNGAPPDDDAVIARILRVERREWLKIRPALERFFDIRDGHWFHDTVERELQKARDLIEKRRIAGVQGGRPKKQTESKQKPNGFSEQKQNETPARVALPLPSPNGELEDADASSVAGAATKGDVRKAFEAWNTLARRIGLPVAKTLDDGRRKAIAKRLEDGGLAVWGEALAAVERSAHCRGENDRGWKADLDFVCQLKSWRRLLEGFYGATATAEATPLAPWPGPADVREAVERGFGDPARAGAFLRACRWRDVPDRALVSDNSFTLDMIRREAGAELARIDVRVVLEKGKDAA